jgi:hypothetical protein
MNENTKNTLIIAAIVVGAILIIYVGIHLLSAIIGGIGPIVMESIKAVFGFIGFVITIGVILLTAFVPIAIFLLSVFFFLKMIDLIRNEFIRLKNLLSKQAREAAIDATFLAILALLAGLMFYVATEDFLTNFSTIRVLTVATAVCCIGKMLVLIPVRSAKVVGLLTSAVVLIGLCVFLVDRYHLVTRSGISIQHVLDVWGNPTDYKRSHAFLLFDLSIISLLLVAAIFYPFTARGWRRMWKIA